MEITSVDESSVKETPHEAEVKPLMSKDPAQFVHIKLEPGQSLRKHITPVDAFFFCIEGDGIVEIGEEEGEMNPGDLVFSPAKVPHLLRNPSGFIFRVLVIKAPKPTSETKIL